MRPPVEEPDTANALSGPTHSYTVASSLRAGGSGLRPRLRSGGGRFGPSGAGRAPGGGSPPRFLPLGPGRARRTSAPRLGLRFPLRHGPLDGGRLSLHRGPRGNPHDRSLRAALRLRHPEPLLALRKPGPSLAASAAAGSALAPYPDSRPS